MWERLLDILKEAKDIRRQEAQQPPAACPLDGTPLEAGPQGTLFCRYCGARVER